MVGDNITEVTFGVGMNLWGSGFGYDISRNERFERWFLGGLTLVPSWVRWCSCFEVLIVQILVYLCILSLSGILV